MNKSVLIFNEIIANNGTVAVYKIHNHHIISKAKTGNGKIRQKLSKRRISKSDNKNRFEIVKAFCPLQ